MSSVAFQAAALRAIIDRQMAYGAWVRKHGLREDPTYDLRGAFEAGVTPNSRGHLTDEFKLPTHPTFSIESRYNGQGGKTGGEWIEVAPGRWQFNASPWNLQNMPREALVDYFDRVEPGQTIRFPDGSVHIGGSK